jgi:toxin YoeB
MEPTDGCQAIRDFSGYWSRRINDEHRIVYRPAEDSILIAQMRYLY